MIDLREERTAVDGLSLHRLLDRAKPSLAEAAALAAVLLEALATMHDAGCTHGDLDCRSVQIGPRGDVRLDGRKPKSQARFDPETAPGRHPGRRRHRGRDRPGGRPAGALPDGAGGEAGRPAGGGRRFPQPVAPRPAEGGPGPRTGGRPGRAVAEPPAAGSWNWPGRSPPPTLLQTAISRRCPPWRGPAVTGPASADTAGPLTPSAGPAPADLPEGLEGCGPRRGGGPGARPGGPLLRRRDQAQRQGPVQRGRRGGAGRPPEARPPARPRVRRRRGRSPTSSSARSTGAGRKRSATPSCR